MPIRFFCGHCKQMLKIGTSKAGNSVECPRCRQSVIVPPQSSPQAEEWYKAYKSKRSEQSQPLAAEPAGKNIAAGTDISAAPTWEELESEDADMPLWMEEAWFPPAALPPESQGLRSNSALAEEVTRSSLQKQHKLIITLLNVSIVLAFLIGTGFGLYIHTFFFVPSEVQQKLGNAADISTVLEGILYFEDENGERREDSDAVVIGFPKNRNPGTLISCQGLRPGDPPNNDTVQMIQEMQGVCIRTDAMGKFLFPYQEGESYDVFLISSHQKPTGNSTKRNVQNILRRYFRDPGLFSENSLEIVEFTWLDGKFVFQHEFKSSPAFEPL